MENVITKVECGGIAEEVGIEVNDILISINDTEIQDIIDYKYLIVDDYIELDIKKPSGEVWTYEIEKDYGEDLGLEFQSGLMDKAKRCSNKCMFCFIDQLPKGMRDTLYFKDDDSRLSFLQGNFVTLTNMKDEDIDRIIRYKISPINISVHTTNPDLRIKMLKNRFAGKIMERLQRLKDAEIEMNAQIVLIPEVNDGEELKRTIEDLYKLTPYLQNVAVVPIGITKFREGLEKVTTFDKLRSKEQILMINEMQKKFINEVNHPFVRLSDEFYLTADMPIPKADFYGEFDQLEDGVGMIRYFRNAVERDIIDLKENTNGSFSIVTGKLAFNEICSAVDLITKKNKNILIDVYEIVNNFFGETITVAGLLTGKDIIEQVKGKINSEFLIMSDNMFRKGYELGPKNERIMLDDITVEDLEKELNVKIIICDYSGDNLIQLINENSKEEK